MLALVAGLLMALLALAGPANAAGSPPASTSGTTKLTSTITLRFLPATPTVECYYRAYTPYQIVNGGTTAGEGAVTSCTTPPPTECKMQVSLFKETPAGTGFWLELPGGSDPGWTTNCSIMATAKYKCQGIVEKSDFYTQVTFSIMNAEGQTATSQQASPTTALWCD